MFEFSKRIFVSVMMFFGCNLSRVNRLKCVSINNQKCKVMPKVVNVNSDEPVFFIFLVLEQTNTSAVVIILMIHMEDCLVLMLLKT